MKSAMLAFVLLGSTAYAQEVDPRDGVIPKSCQIHHIDIRINRGGQPCDVYGTVSMRARYWSTRYNEINYDVCSQYLETPTWGLEREGDLSEDGFRYFFRQVLSGENIHVSAAVNQMGKVFYAERRIIR